MMASRQLPLNRAMSSPRTASSSGQALTPLRRAAGCRRVASICVRAQDGPEGAPSLLKEGTKVRVSTSIKVYHVPKQPQGVELQGLQGEIEKNVALYTDKQGKSHVLSPNFPYIVKLQAQIDGKDVTIKAHLVSVRRPLGRREWGCMKMLTWRPVHPGNICHQGAFSVEPTGSAILCCKLISFLLHCITSMCY